MKPNIEDMFGSCEMPESFTSKLNIIECGHGTPCWLYCGAKTKGGYGLLTYKHKNYYSHRFSYMIHIGGIPEKLQLDHLCRNRLCANPSHLEAVTQKENLLRGEGIFAIHHRKTHCSRGHKYTEDNTCLVKNRYGGFGRQCKCCTYIKNQLRYHPEFVYDWVQPI
jgi:hypothetical protein